MADGLYTNTKTKGTQAEIEALCYFHKNGYFVSIPFGENAPYDLIVESPTKKCYRVQVRRSSWVDDVLPVSLRVISKNYTRTIDLSRIDLFAIWDGDTFYVIPVQEVENAVAFIYLRRVPAKNGQKKRVHLAASFKEALRHCP
jgi:hypothetical protein